MDKFERGFRGRVFATEEGVEEVSREKGLQVEEQKIREKLEQGRGLSKELRDRLEGRLEEIGRELHPKEEPQPPQRRKSIVKL